MVRGEIVATQCALAGCEVIVENLPGTPIRRYCGAAHRAAARRLGDVTNGTETMNRSQVSYAAASASRPVEPAPPERTRTVAAPWDREWANQVHTSDSPLEASSEKAPPIGPHPDSRDQDPPLPSGVPWRDRSPDVGAARLTEDTIMRARAVRPTLGWRGAVYSVSGGRVNPGVSEAESARNALSRRIRRHLPGAHQIAVSSLKGGVGKTTVSAVLGLTLAEYRGDRVVAVDANPDAGTLADRLTGEIGITVRDMLDNLDTIDSLTAVSHYTSLAGRLQVLASEQDPAMSEAFNRTEYERICAVLARFYNIIITDSGTGLVHSAMEGTLALADSLVVVGAPTVDGASRASKTLDWLVAHGYAEQVVDAVVVLCCDRVSPQIDRERVRAHFNARCRAVVEIPHDPHLATGGRLDLDAMREPTRMAFLELGAHIADEFS
jgi:MinD-like ATPase involved in chromosome partitioning or flagellar assembly